ncbi:unnamed protein product [Orchesella dallaii]|uniref:BZIP domain-containing protein n=1 Tax=Orchesella dallaii TaxID=48710 RepID=A0ABP1PWA5_9HEXA
MEATRADEHAHLRGQVMVARGPDSPANDGCNPGLPIPIPNAPMMAANGNRDPMGGNRGAPMFPNGNAGPPPPPFPLQVAFDLTQNVKRKDLFTQRKQREFIPDNKKDESYWDRRRRNNEAAKRSREKRRFNDMILEQRVLELTKENHILKAQLIAIKDKFGISGDNLIVLEQVLATLPSNDQLLNLSKRTKIYPSGGSMKGYDYDHDPDSGDESCHRERLDSVDMGPDDYPGHGSETRSRSPSQHQMERFVAPHPSLPPPMIEIGKPHNVEHHPMYNNYQDDYRDNQSSNTDRSGRSSISPSENILNLSLNGNQSSSESMEHDEEVNSDSDECPSISRRVIQDKQKFGANAEHDEEKLEGPVPNGKFYANGKNNQNNNANGAASNLPHKLRHKSHLGEKELPPYPYVAHGLKQESQVSPPCTPWDHDEITSSGSGSSDERDSGISINGDGSEKYLTENRQPGETKDSGSAPQRKRGKKRLMEESVLETENCQLKSELARLATEVACLKNFLSKKKPTGKEDGNQ